MDYGHNFSTAIVTEGDGTAVDGNVIAVIGQDYEYIPLNTATDEHHNLQARDTLQAAIESAEVDKIELLRGSDDPNIIYENTDSNSHVRFFLFFEI